MIKRLLILIGTILLIAIVPYFIGVIVYKIAGFLPEKYLILYWLCGFLTIITSFGVICLVIDTSLCTVNYIRNGKFERP